jgi:O-antigen ligase
VSTLAEHPLPAVPASRWRIWLLAAAVASAFFVGEQNWQVSRWEDFALDTADMEAGAAEGSLLRQVGFSLVAAIGLVCLICRARYVPRVRDPLALLVLFTLAWCLASVSWSIEPLLTAKRLGVVACCFLGMLGLCRQLSLRELAWLALAVTAVYALAGLSVEMALGTFRPWSAEYRFAGTMHPNGQGVNCGLLCLAAASLAGRSARWNWLLLALAVMGGLLLALSRSRTAVIALAAALATLGLVTLAAKRSGRHEGDCSVSASRKPGDSHGSRKPGRSPAAALPMIGAVVFALCAAALACSLVGYDVGGKFMDLVTLGRDTETDDLNGRLPLWTELLDGYVSQRPLCGYGYNTFWNAANIDEMSSLFYWGIREAHSGYVEALLGIGLIGTAALAATVALALARSLRACLAGGRSGDRFVLAMLVFAVVNSVTESGFVLPDWPAIMVACGLVGLVFHPLAGETEAPP